MLLLHELHMEMQQKPGHGRGLAFAEVLAAHYPNAPPSDIEWMQRLVRAAEEERALRRRRERVSAERERLIRLFGSADTDGSRSSIWP